MTISSVYIINRAGGLIYQNDPQSPTIEVEKTYGFPLEFSLKVFDEKIKVDFGQGGGVKVGHTVLAVNGIAAKGTALEDGRDIQAVFNDKENYPIAIKFGRPKLTTNERIMLAGMFHSLFAISSQLSPVEGSSGILELEADTFKLHCFQTLTGIKFLVLTDPGQGNQHTLLKAMYECYTDYALKNTFYSIDMPIRCDLFDTNLQLLIEQAERNTLNNA